MRDAGLDGRGQLSAGRLPQKVWHLRGPLGRQPNGPTAAPSAASPLELLALNGRKGPQRVEDPEAMSRARKTSSSSASCPWMMRVRMFRKRIIESSSSSETPRWRRKVTLSRHVVFGPDGAPAFRRISLSSRSICAASDIRAAFGEVPASIRTWRVTSYTSRSTSVSLERPCPSLGAALAAGRLGQGRGLLLQLVQLRLQLELRAEDLPLLQHAPRDQAADVVLERVDEVDEDSGF